MKNFFKKLVTNILRAESRMVLKKYKPKIVAITGSVGKTSTKDAIFAALSGFSYVRKSEKSYNKEIGLALTVLGIPNACNNLFLWFLNILKGLWLFIYPHRYPEWLVLEVGVGKPGDMARTALWLETDAVVMTSIGDLPSHVEFFESRKHLVEEKTLLLKTLKKDGILFLNADDETVLELKEKTKNRTLSYGFGEKADVRGSGENILYSKENVPAGILFRVDEEGKSLPITIEGVFGRNHVYASLAALAFCSGFKLNMVEAIDRLKNHSVPPGRMRLLLGIKETLIIDDTYNSSPLACEAALKTLAEIKNSGRKIAVLGDMLELGKHTEEAHLNIGVLAKECAQILVTVGGRAEKIKEGALQAGMAEENIREFSNSTEAGKFLKDFAEPGDFILVKGSQAMRMERAVFEILKDKANAKDLLVRQDDEWLKR